jgi:hypothetical protein
MTVSAVGMVRNGQRLLLEVEPFATLALRWVLLRPSLAQVAKVENCVAPLLVQADCGAFLLPDHLAEARMDFQWRLSGRVKKIKLQRLTFA